MRDFVALSLTGEQSAKFLQGQLTCDVARLDIESDNNWQACAICDLKGRVEFLLWVKRTATGFDLVVGQDSHDALVRHIKKYGAFSKITLNNSTPIYPCITNGIPSFCTDSAKYDYDAWAKASIACGNAWLSYAQAGLFQPQELRLHQRGGLHYDKGCYLGQEVVARLYFKARPKAFLQRVHTTDLENLGKTLVCAVADGAGFDALVVAKEGQFNPTLPLPDALQADVGRPN